MPLIIHSELKPNQLKSVGTSNDSTGVGMASYILGMMFPDGKYLPARALLHCINSINGKY